MPPNPGDLWPALRRGDLGEVAAWLVFYIFLWPLWIVLRTLGALVDFVQGKGRNG